MAGCQERGDGTEKDLKLAFANYKIAADHGNPCATALLQNYFEMGAKVVELKEQQGAQVAERT